MAAAPQSQFARQQERLAYILLAPTLAVIVFIAAWPLYQAVRLSFTNERLGQPGQGEYIGFQNYTDLLGSFRERSDGSTRFRYDDDFYEAVGNTVFLTVIAVVLETVIGVGVALVINSKFKARGLMRTAVLVPWAIPTVVSARMWAWMYNDVFGVLNDMAMRIGLIDGPVAWLANKSTALMAIVAMEVWKTTPFMALLILAGLQIIPGDVYEAADIDGASKIQQFFSVTLPLLRPAILVALIFRTLDSLRIFDAIKVMTNGGSGTEVMATYAHRNMFDFQKLGYGNAISIVIFFIIAIFVVIYVTTLRVEED
ncbi:MAG TPA: sugar ABC transporter permease [Anaerolineae bacterium]|nr:sugar ABC transporter permease [Anaerolineae bacterium]HMR62526.1 sugar ABC transporter permease [Anaerolineae bacterium]